MKKLIIMFMFCVSMFAKASEVYTIVVPFQAGGTSDSIIRYITNAVTDRFSDRFVIINKPGANGVVAFHHFLEMSKNNHNVLLYGTTGTLLLDDLITPSNPNKISYNIKPIVILAQTSLQIITLKDNIKNKPEDFKNSNIGYFTVATELNAKQYGFTKNGNQLIAYKGEATAQLALISKEIDALSTTTFQSEEFKTKIKVIHSPLIKDLYGLSVLSANMHIDSSKVDDLNIKFNRILLTPKVSTWLTSNGMKPMNYSLKEINVELESSKNQYRSLIQ